MEMIKMRVDVQGKGIDQIRVFKSKPKCIAIILKCQAIDLV